MHRRPSRLRYRAEARTARPDSPVHLFCTDFASPAAVRRDLLAEEDFDRLPKLSHPRRRKEFLAGRSLLRFALEHTTGEPGRTHRLRTRADGKLVCVDGPPISLSHSGTVAVCAVAAAGSVGVDVEIKLDRRRTRAIAHSFFAPEESEWLESQPEDRFYMLWVLKEAYLKAMGDGLAGGLDTLRCRVSPPMIEARVTKGAAQPSLALYAFGESLIGIATIDYAFSEVSVARMDHEDREIPVQPAYRVAMTA